jgi:hypothetical protein
MVTVSSVDDNTVQVQTVTPRRLTLLPVVFVSNFELHKLGIRNVPANRLSLRPVLLWLVNQSILRSSLDLTQRVR